jgi:cell division protein FtsN
MKMQRGGFVIGLVIGLLVGLSIALGVALYITKAPVPFMNKVPQRTAEQDTAEAERNKNWDPNAPLGGKAQPPRAAAPAGAAPAGAASAPGVATAPALPPPPGAASAAKPGRDPAAILAGSTTPGASAPLSTAGGPEAFVYFVQAGAFTRAEDAEQQRAKLAMMGIEAKVSEREQAGRTVLRVRAGPFETRGEADALQVRLTNIAIEARLVRVERP